MTISFLVLGTPAPKGSSRAILIRGRAVNVPGGSNANRTKLKSWDASVRERALEQLGERTEPLFVGKPLSVELQFLLARPSGHWGTKGLKPSAPIAPATKPDADKLARSTLDSLTGLVFDDDSRIVSLMVTKRYAAPGQEGCFITVNEYDPDLIVTFSKHIDIDADVLHSNEVTHA
jgi:Holliday junction resolvase RusA-like endonuclease